MVRRLDQGIAGEGETLDAALAYSERFWERGERLRAAMRSDLGISDVSDAVADSGQDTRDG
ncbi:hypothetical protein GCM10020001_109630 [Nonomuraea salmonea]